MVNNRSPKHSVDSLRTEMESQYPGVASALEKSGSLRVTTADKIPKQIAYHGSPHKFKVFRTDKIGMGEGVQAYGWGMYFASKKEIAEFYRDALTSTQNGPLRYDTTSLIPRTTDVSVSEVR